MLSAFIRRSRPFLAVLAAALSGCMTGSEVPNELRGVLVAPGGAAQADAQVTLYRSDAIPGPALKPVATARTDAAGRYRFEGLPAGTYNALAAKSGSRAYLDSLVVAPRAEIDAGTDTLKAPGSLAGRVRLEGPDNPRMALVQVIGTDIYANVDSAGWFALTHLAEGAYRIRVFVADSQYVPEFRVVRIRSGASDTLAEVIAPYYMGPPRITGLKAEALTDGSIRVTWNRARSKDPFTYAIFREASDANVRSGNALRYFLTETDTAYIDTVYSRTPRPDDLGFDPVAHWEVYRGQYPWEDTTAYRFRYYIMLFDLAASYEAGPMSGMVHVVAIPPASIKDP